MFEGQRLNYIVPGYTGYGYFHLDIYLKKHTMDGNLSIKNKELHIFLVMLDMCIPLNLKIFMLKLLVK